MDDRPIGIFDSGVGGLTGLKALLRLLPGEDYVFFADTGRMPYGPRPQGELRAIAVQDMDCLASFGVKAILSACGTISSAAHRELETYPVPAFGVLHPAVAAMAAVGGDAPLGVIATAASIESGQFTEPLRALCPGREIVGLACPEFAPMIEAGHIAPDDPVLREAVARSLAPLRGKRLLVVEQDDKRREIYAKYLGEFNLEHTVVAEMPEALSALTEADFRQQPYHLVLIGGMKEGSARMLDLAAYLHESWPGVTLVLISEDDWH